MQVVTDLGSHGRAAISLLDDFGKATSHFWVFVSSSVKLLQSIHRVIHTLKVMNVLCILNERLISSTGRGEAILVVNLALSILSCVILGKLFHFSESQFLLYSGKTTVHMELHRVMCIVLIQQRAWHIVHIQ